MSRRIVIKNDEKGDDGIFFYDGKTLEAYIKFYDNKFHFSAPIYDNSGPLSKITVSSAIANNAITYIPIGDVETDRTIHLMYYIQRGDAYREGTLRILYDEENGFILDDYQNNNELVGVVFSVDTYQDDIRLIATATNFGMDADFKAIIQKIGI